MSEKKQQKTAPPLLHKNIGNQDVLTMDKMHKELEDSRDQVAALSNELDQRFAEIAILTRLLLEKDQHSDQLLTDSNEKNQQIETLQSLRDSLTIALELKSHAHDDLLSLMTIRDAEIARLRNELCSFSESTSWRVTAPFRYIKKIMGFSAR